MTASKIILIILSLCYWSFGFGQDFRKDIEKINATYQSTPLFHMEIDYNLYASHESVKVYENTSALIYKNRNGYYSKIFNQETVINPDYVILIDHDSKLFMIDLYQQGQTQIPDQDLMDNDSLLNLLQTMVEEVAPAIQEVKKYNGKYIVLFNYGEIEKMELTFNPSTFLFKRVILYYKKALPIIENKAPQKPRLEINYRVFDASPTIPEDIFSGNTYVNIIPNEAIRPKGKMRTYTVINHLWTDRSQH